MKKHPKIAIAGGLLMAAVVSFVATTPARAADGRVTLAQNGLSKAAIYVAPAVMEADKVLAPSATPIEVRGETDRRRLRESVKDLALYLGKISGASAEVLTSPAPSKNKKDKRLPILIGALAQAKFGAAKVRAPYEQGFRVVTNKSGIGLIGQSDLAVSYAIYELLHRIGCRWYIPSELGEVVPQMGTLSVPMMDFSSAPYTHFRNVWYADDDFKRRNRLGGFSIHANHNLEMLVTAKQREGHPEWRAIINGKPDGWRLKWSHPGVQQAVVDSIFAQFKAQNLPADGTTSISISPDDGAEFDQSDDAAWDAGDFDPATNTISLTDRYVKFCNIIAEKVTKEYPNVRLGFYAYVQYTRPPVREKIHPNLVPVIAPITYCRAHSFTDTHICPSRPRLKPVVEGWGAKTKELGYYNYMFHLAETSVPFPMMHQMSTELPILYKNNLKFWQPETIQNFESVLPGMVLTLRKAWNPNENTDAIFNELFTNFYGAGKEPMRRYWQLMDDAWTNSPEHAGAEWGYVRRFTPQIMKSARAVMDEALATPVKSIEYRRIKMQDEALKQFERFMQLRWNLNEGKLDTLDALTDRWLNQQLELGDEYEKQFALGKIYLTPHTIAGGYFKAFVEQSYRDGARIARDYAVISPPLREWKFATDKDKQGEARGWHTVENKDADWKTTDLATETWSDIGLFDYGSTVWYRQSVNVPAVPAGKKTYLWIPSEDGEVQAWVNGQAVSTVVTKGEPAKTFAGYGQPVSFDITNAVKGGGANQITIRATRLGVNELGSGGLLMPTFLYQEK